MKKDITELYCFLDDFVKSCHGTIKSHMISCRERIKKATRKPGLNEGEIMTIMLLFHQSSCKNLNISINRICNYTSMNLKLCLVMKDL